ncbi:hypothetical protein, partial [Escherichia coli]|uniref:hypothetical protein n=1 Tax=Escherichia coli TaxID=562 RepID=UPI0019540C2B
AHIGVASTAAFMAAAIDPASGHDGSDQVDTDAGGGATGVVRGRMTQHFVRLANSDQGVDDFLAGFPAVMANIAANGITGLHNALT